MSLLAVVLCGAGLVAAGFPARAASASSRLFRAAAGAALGIGTHSAFFAAVLMASGKPPGQVEEAALCALGAALWAAFRRKHPGSTPPYDPAPRWLWGLFGIASALAAAAVVEHTIRFPDGGWDAWMIWNVRARFLARAPDYRTAFSPDLLYLMHQDYPWLLPGAVAEGFAAAGESFFVPVLFAAIFGIVAVALVGFRLSEREGARWGLLGALALVTFPRFLISVADQQSDVPLCAYIALASALVVAESDRELWLAGFAAGLGMWTKNEGSLYAAALLGGLLLRERDLRRASMFVLGALPFAALLVWFKTTLAPPTDLAAYSTVSGILHNAFDLPRWGELLVLFLRRIVYFQQFGLWLVAACVAAVILAWRGSRLSAAAPALLAACAAFACVYVFQSAHEMGPLFRTSADRLFVQMWPTFVLAFLAALAQRAVAAFKAPSGSSTSNSASPAPLAGLDDPARRRASR
jgi:hypothetical protein